MASNSDKSALQRLPWSLLRAGGRHGLSDDETRDPIGLAVAALNKLAQSDVIDRLGLRKTTERGVYRVTSAGFRTAGAAGRTFARAGKKGGGKRVPAAPSRGLFDLTPSEDERMLVDVVSEYVEEMLRPAAAAADEACAAPDELLKASLEIGLPILGVSEDLGGIATERSSVAGVLVHEALAKGDMGLAVAAMAPGAVATALSLWGTDEQQSTYLPAFADDKDVPAAALALAEPKALFDPLNPATTAVRDGDGYVLDGTKSAVVRGADAELFVVGAELDGKPQLFLVESSSDGVTIESDPSMGVRAASLSK
ncbi:MAG TPA: acyl-CoA dehydrogenase family protein, partial [Marmoricola sp.]|nr:acyl-CoA dehydrogenase family protein [Marmoricola sp.]